MKIAHYKKTPIALAPDELSNCINKYTEHESFVNENFNECDIIQYHNRYIKYLDLVKMKINRKILLEKPSFILYHSFPEITDNYNEVFLINSLAVIIRKIFKKKSSTILLNNHNHKYLKYLYSSKKQKINQMVIGQYQATLEEYKNYKIVRNIIDFNKNIYSLKHKMNSEIKIGYSPSITNKKGRSIWETKGYNRTIKVIKNLSKIKKIKYDIITNVSLEECLIRKSQCNIIIDECVTASYHRSALEGLALGKMTICSIGKKVENNIKNITKCSNIPFENIWIDSLEKELEKIINLGSDYINLKGDNNRKWMQKYWNPIDIVNEHINYYNDKLKNE